MALIQCCSGFVGFFNLFKRPKNTVNFHNLCAYQNHIMARPSFNVQHIPTLYEETHRGICHRGKWRSRLQILSLGNSPALIAYLEHHEPTTDGSFAVCIAAGNGNFISQELYNSIPEEHRPQMKAKDRKVTFLLGQSANTLGQVFVPILLTNAKNGERFRIVLHAYVLERMSVGMFINHPRWIEETLYRKDGWEHICNFREGNAGKGNVVMLKGIQRK